MGEILKKENIILNCKPDTKENVIRRVGQILYDHGYVNEDYIDSMVEKEKIFNTAIGNQVAIPHGTEAAKNEILHSGLVVLVFPEGTDWGDGKIVKLVIGIAGVGDEHMDILMKIAENVSDQESLEALIQSDVETIYNTFV